MVYKNSSAYIHIPFCNNICSYCDFCKVFYNEKLVSKYLDSLEKEIKDNYNNETLKTIYIGGGTPSSLSLSELKKLFNILNILKKDTTCEYTIECNIEDINNEKLLLMKENGINRISIGVESFNDNILKFLGRKNTGSSALEKIKLVQKYFDNINIDLMYAIPGEDIKDLENDIDILLDLNIPHISLYSLIIEDNTVLKNKGTDYIDEELDYEMYQLILKKLKHYNHYEVSNFSQPGYESKHNLVYWNNLNYYGFGCGASGYINNIRYDNTRSITNYINGNINRIENKLDLKETIENEFILGLRKMSGIDKEDFYNKYKKDIHEIDNVSRLLKENKLMENKKSIYINPDYIYTSNDILIEFLN